MVFVFNVYILKRFIEWYGLILSIWVIKESVNGINYLEF